MRGLASAASPHAAQQRQHRRYHDRPCRVRRTGAQAKLIGIGNWRAPHCGHSLRARVLPIVRWQHACDDRVTTIADQLDRAGPSGVAAAIARPFPHTAGDFPVAVLSGRAHCALACGRRRGPGENVADPHANKASTPRLFTARRSSRVGPIPSTPGCHSVAASSAMCLRERRRSLTHHLGR